MKIPRTALILGRKVKIEVIDLGYETMGQFNPSENLIQINANLKKEDILPTVIHEFLHVAENVAGLDQDIPLAVRHVFIEAFTNTILQSFDLVFKKK